MSPVPFYSKKLKPKKESNVKSETATGEGTIECTSLKKIDTSTLNTVGTANGFV